MSAEVTQSDEIGQYLQRLRRALRHALPQDRDDYVEQISEHLNETRMIDDSLESLILRVGSPEALAREFYAAERARLSSPIRLRRWLRQWWAGLLGLVAILALIPAVIWVNSFQPLDTHLDGEYNDSVVAVSGTPPKELLGGLTTPVTWELTSGRYRVNVLFGVTNMNSLTVNIAPPEITNGFPNPVKWYVESFPRMRFINAQIKGGQYKEILFSETYVCSEWPKGSPTHGASTTFISTLPIVESFFGIQRTVDLPIQPFYLQFAGNCFGLTN